MTGKIPVHQRVDFKANKFFADYNSIFNIPDIMLRCHHLFRGM